MMSLMKPLWKEHGMDYRKRTAICHENSPHSCFAYNYYNLKLTENTLLMLKMDPEK